MVSCDLDVLKVRGISQCKVQVTQRNIATPCDEVEAVALMKPSEAERGHDSLNLPFVQHPHLDPRMIALDRQFRNRA
jgi:hypothetical protein